MNADLIELGKEKLKEAVLELLRGYNANLKIEVHALLIEKKIKLEVTSSEKLI